MSLLVALGASPAFAIDAEPSPGDPRPVLHLPRVEVIGSRQQELERKYPDLQPDSAFNPYRVAPSSRLAVQTLTAKDIDALKPLDVFDLLNHAVGVLTLYQGRKVPYSTRIRGDLYFAYIIDGVYIPSEDGGRILQNLPVAAIEQVEVVRDATALTLAPMVDFGRPSGAPNDGYIVIRTRRPLRTEGTATVRVESYDTHSASLYTGTANDSSYISALASNYDSAGRAGEFMAKQSSSGMVRAGLGDGWWRVEASVFGDSTKQQIQAADPRQSTLALQRWELRPIDTTFAALNASAQWTEHQTTTLTVSAYRLHATLIAGTALPGIAPRIFPNRSNIDNVDLKHTVRVDDSLLRFGLQRMRWDTPTGASYFEGYARKENITGLFATAEQGFFDRHLTIDIAARRDQQKILQGVDHYYAYEVLFQQPSIQNRRLPADRFLSLGAAWSPSADWKLTARTYVAGQGAVESVPAVGNKVLDPERQRKFEFGVAFSGWEVFRPALTAFSTRIRNTKFPAQEVRGQDGLTTSLWDQTNVRRDGFELLARGEGRLADVALDYTLGWTALYGDTTNEDYGRTSPRNTLAGTVHARAGAWEGAVSLSAVDEFASNWKAIDRQFHPIGYYSRLDFNIGRRFQVGPTSMRASLYGRNVLDQRYETQLGYRDIGALWGVELLVNY